MVAAVDAVETGEANPAGENSSTLDLRLPKGAPPSGSECELDRLRTMRSSDELLRRTKLRRSDTGGLDTGGFVGRASAGGTDEVELSGTLAELDPAVVAIDGGGELDGPRDDESLDEDV